MVRSQLIGTLAVLLKRGWTDMAAEERLAFFRVRSLLFDVDIPFQHTPPSIAAAADNIVGQFYGEGSCRTSIICKNAPLLDKHVELFNLGQEVEGAAGSNGSSDVRRMGLDILEAVVSEFSPVTASAMGLPWDYHEKCRASFEVLPARPLVGNLL